LIASIFPPEEVYKRSVNKGEAWEQFLRRFEIIILPPRPLAPALAPAAPLEEESQEALPDWAAPLAWDDGSDWGRSPGGD